MKKLWHRLMHLLGLNRDFFDVWVENNVVYTGIRCSTCDAVRGARQDDILTSLRRRALEDFVRDGEAILETIEDEFMHEMREESRNA